MKHLIIGLGSIGKRHARNLLDHGQEVTGVDPYATGDFGFPVHPTIDSAWQWGAEVAWICSPTSLHAEQAEMALEKGLHVFIEKPIAAGLNDADRISLAWKKNGKRLVWVGCNMRFHPAAERLKQALEDGLIGRPLILRIHFSHFLPNMRPGVDYRQTYAARAELGGGIILDDIHDIDLALWLGGPVRRVAALAARSGVLEMDAEDMAHITLLHRSGVFSEIHMDFLRKDKSRGVEVIGEKGSLEWRSTGKNPERASLLWMQEGNHEPKVLWRSELTSFDEMFERQLSEIMRVLSSPESYGRRLEEGIEALKIAEEARSCLDCAR